MAHPCVKLAVASVLAATGMGCFSTPPQTPFDPRAMGDYERVGAAEPRPERPMNRLPTTLESPYAPNQPLSAQPRRPRVERFDAMDNTVRLSLREIVQRTVINNLDIRVAGFDPAIENTRVTEAEARFDLTLFASNSLEYTNQNTAGQQFNGGANGFPLSANRTRGLGFNQQVGIRQLLPSGGQAELRYETARTDQNPSFFDLNEFWTSQFVFQLTQPLLRDFGNDVNRARIVINRLNKQISVLEFRRQVEETVLTLEQRYWELTQALEEVRIQEELLEKTIDTADVLFKRRAQDVTSVQISQAIASIKSRTATLIDARRNVQDLSDQIKRLMNDPDLPVASQTLLLPDNPPLLEPLKLDFQDAVNVGLLARLELGQQKLRVDSAAVALNVAKNNLLPQLNAVFQVGVQGLDGDWIGSNADIFDNDTGFVGSIGFQFEYPIGNRAARAIYARASLQRQQAMASYANLVNQVALDVKTSLRDVETSWELIGQQQQNRFAATEALSGLELRERNNEPLTPNFVDLKLTLQQQLAEAKRAEAAAISSYNVAISRFEQAKGTLLRYNNVVLDEAALPVGK